MLFNILEENALLPHPKPGCHYKMLGCTETFESNILEVLDPEHLKMLYTLGYHIPAIYSQVNHGKATLLSLIILSLGKI